MYDIVFRNGRVVDGTRKPWFNTDVAVNEGKIAAENGKRTEEVSGKALRRPGTS